MIPLEKQCVSLKLTKRLKELGVRQESLFYWCGFYNDSGGKTWFIVRHDVLEDYEEEPENYAAFTVAELGEMLPKIAIPNTNYYGSKTEDGRWEVGYVFMDGSGIYHLEVEATEADARAKMLIYLVENKLVTLSRCRPSSR
jgi:hypothetical protein